MTKIGTQVRATGTQFDGLQSHVAKTSTGLEQFRSVINGLAGGSNMAASTIANAMVPSLDRLFGSLNNATSGWKAQQAAAQEAANGLVDAANDAIATAQAARTQSLAQAAIAEKTLATAAAQREQAFALDEYYAKQALVNKEYGITVAYDEEHEQNARTIAEANLAEAAAQTKLAAATEAVAAADAAEIEGKAKLAAAQEAVDLANQKVTLSSKAASAAGGAFNGLLGLVGGAPGLAIMAVVTSLTALYSWYDKTSDETKKFNAAIMENYGSMGLTASQLQSLVAQLGNTDGAIKSVTGAAKAGFTGDMLDQVSSLGAQLNELGGDSDELVKQLTSLRGDPLKALQELTNAGVVLNANQIEQIASLQRQGDISGATALAEQYAMDVISQKLKSQQTDLQNNAGWWDKLKDSVAGAMAAIGQADIDNARLMGAMTGTDIDQPAQNAQALADQQKQQAAARQKAAADEQNAALARLKTETDINTAIKAGADPQKRGRHPDGGN
ncbi:phage tail length tape measure family protein [Acerihabitans sp. KWT182]|uniref:Phage tail length tape measure family protein n=1 Tax=Acerihabitans sp. KWT182 TaxID=3157919 RepID=A0AAU7QE20_9GAMM